MERYQKRQYQQRAPHGREHYSFGSSLLTFLMRTGLLWSVWAPIPSRVRNSLRLLVSRHCPASAVMLWPLRVQLAERLPTYMVPAAVVVIDALR